MLGFKGLFRSFTKFSWIFPVEISTAEDLAFWFSH